MASLPPGWEADYDGRRWFYTYGPTGQSQFHFPRPGDEFPDVLCAAGAGAEAFLPPAAELTPEERLESGRQVRRLLNAGAAGAAGEEAGSGGGDDGGSNVCFESFAAIGSRRGQASCGSRERNGTPGQGPRGVGGGAGVPARTGEAGAPGRPAGEPVPVPGVTKGEDAQASSPPPRAADSPAAISVMSEPVLAETATAAPLRGHRGEHWPAAVARPPPTPDAANLEGLAVDRAQTAPPALPVEGIPELYSESTALCEHEINPPPVELPAGEGGLDVHPAAAGLAIRRDGPAGLPAHEGPRGVGPRRGSSLAGAEQKSWAPQNSAGDHVVASNGRPGEAPGPKGCAYDRAGLPSQALRIASKIPPCTAPPRDGVSSAPGQEPPRSDAGQPSGAERKDMAHFPSVLRPGPRRSAQPPPQQPGAVMPAPATSTSYADRVRPYRPQEQQGQQHPKEMVGAGLVSREQPARMPTMPLMGHPREVPTTAAAPAGKPQAAPRPAGGAGGIRMPDPVDFVVPVRHITRGEPPPAPQRGGAEEGWTPRYRGGASCALGAAPPPSAGPPPPRAGGQASGGGAGSLPGRRTGSWDRHAGGAESAGEVPEWSWGYAR